MPRVNAKILTAGILDVFRGLEFESDADSAVAASALAKSAIGQGDVLKLAQRSGYEYTSITISCKKDQSHY